MLLLVFALLGGCSKEGVSKEAGPIISEEVPNANENVKDNKEKIDKNDLKDNEQDLVNTVEETLEETIEEVGLNETIDINEQKEEETVEETESQTPTYTKVDDIRYVSSPVNVRKGPGVSYKKIGTLVRGQEVTRIGVADNGWGVIIYEGEEGYVSGRYLVESKPKDKVEDTTETEKVEQETKVIKETPKVQQPAKEDSKQAISDSKQVTETTSKEPESQETSEGNSSETESSASNESNKEDIVPQEPDETNPIREPLLVEQIKGIGGSNQVITVTNQSASSVQVTIQAFEKIDGEWKEIYNLPGVIGLGGFASGKREGDKKTPTGIYTLGTAFGTNSNPGTKMPYRQTTSNDYWVDDVNSPLYNTWQEGPSDGRWESAEKLAISLYKYAIAINYNTECIPGKGSCIFMHIWKGASAGTSGCVALSEANLLNLLKWLDPSKSPVIVMGSINQVLGM